MVSPMKCIIALILFLGAAAPALARDFWEFPETQTIPDGARFLLYDPTLPANDPDHKARVLTGANLKNLVPTQTDIIGKLSQPGGRVDLKQGQSEEATEPKIIIRDKSGVIRMTIDATGAIVLK